MRKSICSDRSKETSLSPIAFSAENKSTGVTLVPCTLVTTLADRKKFFVDHNLCLIVDIQTTE